MALCIGFEVVGLMAYSEIRNIIMRSGRSHVYRRQVSAKRWRRERLRRRLGWGLLACFCAPSNCWNWESGLGFRIDALNMYLLVCWFDRTHFVHCGHCRCAGVTSNVHAQG
jgi:hypothetical protein